MDEAEQKLEAITNRLLLQHLRRRYEQTGNGIHAWRAWRLARELGGPPPDWLLRFVDQVASDLASEAIRGEEMAGNRDRNVAEAVGLPRIGRFGALNHAARERRDRDLAGRVGTLIAERGISRAQAVARVSRSEALDRKTVGAAFDRWNQVLSRPLRESGES